MEIVSNPELKKKKGLCLVKNCGKAAADKQVYCHKHKGQNYREKYPFKYAYQELKKRALRRGKIFKLSFEYFVNFCKKNKYLEKKGINKDDYSIDRIKDEFGYIEGNIQILTVSGNSRKQWVDKRLREKYGVNWQTPEIDVSEFKSKVFIESGGDCPF